MSTWVSRQPGAFLQVNLILFLLTVLRLSSCKSSVKRFVLLHLTCRYDPLKINNVVRGVSSRGRGDGGGGGNIGGGSGGPVMSFGCTHCSFSQFYSK